MNFAIIICIHINISQISLKNNVNTLPKEVKIQFDILGIVRFYIRKLFSLKALNCKLFDQNFLLLTDFVTSSF